MEHITNCQQCKKPLTDVQVYCKRKYCSLTCVGEAKKSLVPWNKKDVEKTFCIICKKELTHTQSREKRAFCSVKCSAEGKKGSIPWNKGKKGYLSAETIQKLSKATSERLKNLPREKMLDMVKRALAKRKENGTQDNGRLGKRGILDPNWKGEKATDNAKHRWIQMNWEKTGVCEDCGCIPISKGRNNLATHWSNNDHEYRRVRDDWQELCPKCHYKKDKQLT